MEQLNKVDVIRRLQDIRDCIHESAQKANRDVSEINVMAVTKTVDPQFVNIAIENGIILLGENRVQEFLGKCDQYSLKKEGIHFIGHLQTNKVKYIIDKVSMIESVGSIRLANEIDLRARSNHIKMPILLEINISNEETKSGLLPQAVKETLKYISELENVSVEGLMCIPAKENVEYYFGKMNALFQEIKDLNMHGINMRFLSMGMSNDYQKAILYNSNIIRLGSAIFGKR